jgi:hypothetical protein
MPDRVLQKHNCVAPLQHRLSHNVTMSVKDNQQNDEQVAPIRPAEGPGRALSRFHRVGLVVVALLGASVLAAGCGAAPSGQAVASLGKTTTTTGPSAARAGSTTNPANSALAFVNCLRTHGVPNMPEPVVSGRNVHITVTPGLDPSSPQFIAADNACKHLLPDNGVPTRGTITPADQADYLRAVACMRSHGFPDFPDPVFHDGTVTFNSRTIDPNTPQYKSALTICQELIPAGLPYSGPSAS